MNWDGITEVQLMVPDNKQRGIECFSFSKQDSLAGHVQS